MLPAFLTLVLDSVIYQIRDNLELICPRPLFEFHLHG